MRNGFLEYDRLITGELPFAQFRKVCDNLGLQDDDILNNLKPFLLDNENGLWDYEVLLCLIIENHSLELRKILQRFKNIDRLSLIESIFNSYIGKSNDHLTRDELMHLLSQFDFKFVQSFDALSISSTKEKQIQMLKERERRQGNTNRNKSYREESLELIKESRERQKREILKALMKEREVDVINIHPFMGQLFFFEWRMKNPCITDELFEIEVQNDRNLQLVISKDEWKYYKANCKQDGDTVPSILYYI